VRAPLLLAGLFAALGVAAGAESAEEVSATQSVDAGWTQAVPGWIFEFPRDHGPHRNFKTEWWYFTGNLNDVKSGRKFGFDLTFSRQGIRPADRGTRPSATPSRFAVNDFKFAHFAISDLDEKKFHFDSKVTRGAFAEAGFGDPSVVGQPLTWI